MARDLVSDWPAFADQLASRFWPGPLTLVLPKNDRVPLELTAGLDTVGLRMPSHSLAVALIASAGVPIAAPSANRFMQLSPTTAQHVEESLGAAVDLILDGGPTSIGIESTVLSLTGGVPLLLRPGMITRAQIEDCIGPVGVLASLEGAHPSPGMQDRHYSPKTALYLVEGAAEIPRRAAAFICISRRPRPEWTPWPCRRARKVTPGPSTRHCTVSMEKLGLDRGGKASRGPWVGGNSRSTHSRSLSLNFLRHSPHTPPIRTDKRLDEVYETARFGTIRFEEDEIVEFPAGLPGFEEEHQFC